MKKQKIRQKYEIANEPGTEPGLIHLLELLLEIDKRIKKTTP
jgi:hypothetical protein